MTIPKGLAARAVIELDDGRRFYIDIKDSSMFVQFYTVYMVRYKGRKRTTDEDHSASVTLPPLSKKLRRNLKSTSTPTAQQKSKTRQSRSIVSACTTSAIRMRPDELGLARVYNDLSGYLRKHQKLPATFIRKEEAALA